MIIEYRKTNNDTNHSVVLRTYKDVHSVQFENSGVAQIYGLTPAKFDNGFIKEYAQAYIIAAIKLQEGEYLERVDLPRD